MPTKRNRTVNLCIHLLFIFLCLFILYPIWCIIAVSFTGKEELAQDGFSLLPRRFDILSYKYLWDESSMIVSAYETTIMVALVGMCSGCLISTMYAYVLSRHDFPLRKLLSFLMLFTMFFGGGMAASYIVNVSILQLKNTFWILVLPTMFNSVNVIIARAYFLQLPYSMLESAKIDGAGEYTLFFRIVAPLSKPVVATVCLTLFINYWNAYYEAMMYMDTGNFVTIQLMLHRLLSTVDFLKANASSQIATQEIAKLPSDALRMAVCVLTVVPVLLVFPRFQKYFVKGIAIGAVKE